MPLSLMPDYIYQQFTADGKPLSGGTIYFYQSGTLTPKTVYADAAGSTPLGTSVVLSASGTAVIFLDSGAYRIWIKDSTGAPVAPWVDGIVSGGGFGVAGSNASVGFLMLYNDLRALSAGPDVAYVCGNTAEGDGGEGWFQLQPGDTTADDGGIFLTAAGGSLVYKRIFDAVINPEWYGVHYGINADQSAALVAALSGSAAVNLPVLASKRVYLTQNVAVPIGAALVAGDDGFFTSPGSITMTFPVGSRFDAQGVTFGSAVQPLFAAGVIDSLRLSWFGGADSDKWSRLFASASASFPLLMDVSTTLTGDLTIPANLALEPVGGAVVTFGGFANISIGSLNYRGLSQFIAYSTGSYVGSVSIGAGVIYLEWFGGLANDNAADNTLALHCCTKAGVWTAVADYYRIGASYTAASAIKITGDSTEIEIAAGAAVVLADATVTGIVQSGAGTLTSSTSMNVRDSVLTNPVRLGECRDSVITAMAGTVRGNIIDSSVTGSFAVAYPNLEFVGATFAAVGPLITDIGTAYHLIVRDCDLTAVESLLYTTDTAVVLDVINCRGAGIAYSNGFAIVNLVGTETHNPTATTINGIECKGADVAVIRASEVITTFTESGGHKWFGLPAGTISDGASLILGAAITLANPATPSVYNTLRYRRGLVGSSTEYGLLALGYFGGYIDLEVTYPIGVTPDPAVRLVAQLVRPKLMYSSLTYLQTDISLCAHNAYGVAVGYSASAPGTYRTRTCVWGGLTLVSYPPITAGGMPSMLSVRDEWSDTVLSGATSPALSPTTAYYESMRIVVGNAGSGSVPAGTKIKVTLIPSLPRRQAFDTFFAEAPKAASTNDGGFEPQAMAYRDVVGTDKAHLFADRISSAGKLLYLNVHWRNGFSYSLSGGPSISMPAYQYWASGFPVELENSWLTLEMRTAGIMPHAEDQTKLFAFHRSQSTVYQSQYYAP